MTDERSEGMGGGRVAADELRLLIERAERLEEEKKGISDDIKDVMGEATARGYDAKAIKKILATRKKKKAEYNEAEANIETQMRAQGMMYPLRAEERVGKKRSRQCNIVRVPVR